MLFLLNFFYARCAAFFLNWLQQKSEYIKSFSCPLVSLYFLARCKLFWVFLFSRCCCTNKHDNSLYRQKEKMDNHKKKLIALSASLTSKWYLWRFSRSFLPVANDKTIKILIFLAMKFESIRKLFHHSRTRGAKSDIVF